MKARTLAAVTAVTVLASVGQASAFCRTRGCNDQAEDCTYDEKGCLVSGRLLYWNSNCISYSVHRDGSVKRGITYDAANEAIGRAFGEWLGADCGNGAGPGLQIQDFGPVSCGEAQYNQEGPNANLFTFRDDAWPYENAVDTLALTTLIFNADTGEIYDADVEVNTFESDMALGTVGRSDIDFASVITHEIGHFLGLSHSTALGATMRPSYAPGNTAMASIEADDEAGVCAVHPPSTTDSRDSCEPRHGFSTECALPDGGCQLSPARPRSLASALVGLLALSSLLRRRRPRPSALRP